MKSNWQTKKLGEIILENNKSLFRSKGNEKGAYPFFVSGFKIKSINKYLIDGENIFLPTGGNFFVHYFNGKASYSTDTWAIKTNKNTDVRYLYYFLILDEEFIGKKLFKGATIKHLQKNDFKNLEIPLPHLSEQKRIVKILDEVFEKIAKAKENTEKNLQNAKELFESYLQGVFDNSRYNYKTLGSVCEIIGGGTPSKTGSNFAKFYNGSIPWATVRDMKNEIIIETEHRITKEAVENSSTNIIPKGNVVIATRVGLGKICLIENNTAINQDLRGIVPINQDKLLVNYLFHWLKSVADIIKKEGTGATVQGVKLPFVKSLLIPIPETLRDQKSIVKKLDALSAQTKKLEAIYKQKLEDLEELKKSVLKKAFSGEL